WLALEVEGEVLMGDRARLRAVGLEHHGHLDSEQRAVAEDLARTACVVGWHDGRVCSGCALGSQGEHARSEGSEDARRVDFALRPLVRRNVHRVEVYAQLREWTAELVAANLRRLHVV